MNLKSALSGIIDIVYPRPCGACGEILNQGEEVICLHCQNSLPWIKDQSQLFSDPLSKFHGLIEVESFFALLKYRKNSKAQKLISGLKYNNRKDIGLHLGRIHGRMISQNSPAKFDAIVPVPLHPLKEKRRGYNQSQLYAEGLAEAMEIPIRNDLVEKVTFSSSQTSRGRHQRFEHVKSHYSKLTNTNIDHVLVVDDVSTTGATIGAVAHEILEAGAKKVSLATIGLSQ